MVKGVTNTVIAIITETVRLFYKCGDKAPRYLVSMRTPYKVFGTLGIPSAQDCNVFSMT